MKTHKLQIGAFPVTVSYMTDETQIKSNFGFLDYNKGHDYSITINPTVPDYYAGSILIHEMIEAANLCYGLELEHPTIQTLEAALYQLMPEPVKQAIAKWLSEVRQTPHEKYEDHEGVVGCCVRIDGLIKHQSE